MKQEDKELLLKDLCARLSYNIKVKTPKGIGYIYAINTSQLTEVTVANDEQYWSEVLIINNCKPYLRPMSNMTEEEKRHISKMMCLRTYDDGVVYDMTYPVYTPYYIMEDCLSYLRSIHVDYSGLIEKGLAIEAKEGMYEY